MKKAEEEEAVIVRLYECFNRRTRGFSGPLRRTSRQSANAYMLEADMEELQPDGRKVSFRMIPYEIKTLKLKF